MFFNNWKKSQALNNLARIVQNCNNAVNMYDSDSIMSCCTPVISVSNTLKKIYLGGTIWDEFTSEYYNDNNDAFGRLFQKYTASDINNIYHPCTVIEWNSNMDKSYY